MNGFTNDELARQIAVLEERINTNHAEQDSALERFRAQTAEFEIRLAQRENRIIYAIFGAAILMTAVLSLVITTD